MELLIMVDALKRASAKRLTLLFLITVMRVKTEKQDPVSQSQLNFSLTCLKQPVRLV